MDAAGIHKMGAVFGVEVIKIRHVLEVVGVFAALLHGGVGNHVVAVFRDLQVNALLGQNVFHGVQNFGVRGGGGGDLQGDRFGGRGAGGGSGTGRAGSRRAGSRRAGAGVSAGGKRSGEAKGQRQSKQFSFHQLFLH